MEFLQTFVHDSGPLIWPIVIVSVIVLGLIIERNYFWLGLLLRRDVPLRKELLGLRLRPKRVRDSGDPVAVVYYEYLRRPFDVEGAKRVAETYLRECRSHHGAIRLFCGLSTSLGLLGTVVGIAQSFQGFDQGNLDRIVRGLSTALNTTIAGLMVYLFGTLCLAIFDSRASRESIAVEEGMNRIRVALLDGKRAREPAEEIKLQKVAGRS